MSGPYEQLEREEEELERELALGNINNREYNEQLRELHRDYQQDAMNAADDAREREMDNWY